MSTKNSRLVDAYQFMGDPSLFVEVYSTDLVKVFLGKPDGQTQHVASLPKMAMEQRVNGTLSALLTGIQELFSLYVKNDRAFYALNFEPGERQELVESILAVEELTPAEKFAACYSALTLSLSVEPEALARLATTGPRMEEFLQIFPIHNSASTGGWLRPELLGYLDNSIMRGTLGKGKLPMTCGNNFLTYVRFLSFLGDNAYEGNFHDYSAELTLRIPSVRDFSHLLTVCSIEENFGELKRDEAFRLASYFLPHSLKEFRGMGASVTGLVELQKERHASGLRPFIETHDFSPLPPAMEYLLRYFPEGTDFLSREEMEKAGDELVNCSMLHQLASVGPQTRCLVLGLIALLGASRSEIFLEPLLKGKYISSGGYAWTARELWSNREMRRLLQAAKLDSPSVPPHWALAMVGWDI